MDNFARVFDCKKVRQITPLSEGILAMFKFGSLMLRTATVLAVVGGACLTGIPEQASAQGTPGFTIFSGVKREDQLAYFLDYGGKTGVIDRYHLRIPSRKVTFAISKLAISYPQTYRGEFDPEQVQVRVKNESVPLSDVVWDKENRVIEIYPQDPIPANNRVEVVLSNVRNPIQVGTHYFNAMALSPGDLPIMRYLGTWILSIDNNNNN